MHALRLAVRSGTLAGVLLALACRRVTPSPPPGADASAPLVITKPPASAGMSNPAAPPDAEAPDAAGGDAGADAGAGEQLERVKDSPNGADVGTLTLTRRTQDAIDFSLSVANGYYMGQLV